MIVKCVCCGNRFDFDSMTTAGAKRCPHCGAPLDRETADATYFPADNPAMGERDPVRSMLRATAYKDAERFQAQLKPAKGRKRRG